MTSRDFIRRDVLPWAKGILQRVTSAMAAVLDSFVAGQAPEVAVLPEKP